MKWYKWPENKPTEDKLYIVYAPSMDKDKPFLRTAWYDPSGFGWSLMPAVFIDVIEAWMELPEPPKGD